MEKPLSKNEDMKPAGGMETQCAQYSTILHLPLTFTIDVVEVQRVCCAAPVLRGLLGALSWAELPWSSKIDMPSLLTKPSLGQGQGGQQGRHICRPEGQHRRQGARDHRGGSRVSAVSKCQCDSSGQQHARLYT